MKYFVASLFLVFNVTAFGQNSVPVIQILSVEVDEVGQELSLSYLLSDAEGDACEVWLKYSEDGATYFEMVPEQNLSGDVGEDIQPADALNLVWNYSGIAGDIGDLQLRIFASDHQEFDIAGMVAQVEETQLLSALQAVEGVRHYTAAPGHLEAVRNQIFNAFEEAGLQAEDHDFVHNRVAMRNILGRKPGAKDESITYIIDGHFDGVPNSPGADDNGSAVAGVLEAMRILSQYEFEHSIRFVGFDAEELGLVGSLRYVQNGIKPFESIEGVMNFEMIAYYSDEPNSQQLPAGFGFLFPEAEQAVADEDFRGNFLTVVGNVASNPLIAAYVDAAAAYVPELRIVSVALPGTGTIAPDLRRSDHSRFWDAGMQALMLTDGADFRNANYHTPGDTIGTLDFAFMANVVKATVAAAAQLAVPISASHDDFDLSAILSVHGHKHDFPAGLELYPNPTNGILNLQLSKALHPFRARLEVFSISGQQVHREVLNFPSGTSNTSVNLQKLTPGAYILHLNSDEGIASASFIVDK